MTGSSLRTPPKLAPDTLRVIPLGGLGDVGRNMATLELNGKLLLIDCGVLFPEDHHPGVDLILPGLDAIADRMDDITALVLTHGHEDHIGAVPYLLRRRPDIPIYASKLTLAFVESKIREHRIKNPDLNRVVEGDRVKVGGFDLEFLAVNHSIPDAMGVFVRTSAGTVLHTGDFKMDQLPLDGRITDLRAFARLGAEGVDLFMCDSTNAEVPGFVPSEREIEPAIARVFAQARQKLIVACFASHVHRVQQVLDLAVQHDRKVVYVWTIHGAQHAGGPRSGLPQGAREHRRRPEGLEHLPDDRWSSSPPVRRVSRCRLCRASPTASTRWSRSAPVTRCCWPRP